MKTTSMVVACLWALVLASCLSQKGEMGSVRGEGVDLDPRGGLSPGDLRLMRSEKRVALVIGNGAYETGSFSPLKNPTNDAIDVRRALEGSGFKVLRCEDKDKGDCLNLTRKQMSRAFQAFGAEMTGGGVGLVFYAGHGMQIGGRNYLVPVDAEMNTEADADSEAYSVDAVLSKIGESQGRLNIVILDACRNNPFDSRFRSAKSRDAGVKGLAAVTKGQLPSGTLLAFATSPGSVASDGEARNGTYTAALLKHMATPGLRLRDMFDHVRLEVEQETGRRQVPWENSALHPGRFYFKMPVVCDANDGEVLRDGECVSFCVGNTHFDKDARGCVENERAPGPAPKGQGEREGDVAVSSGGDEREKEDEGPPARVEERGGMVRVAAGKFLRGSEDGEEDEKPMKEVYLDEYWIDVFEVTVEDYKACVDARGCEKPKKTKSDNGYYNWGHSDRGKHPINGVDWTQAVAFCKWKGKRLPTEAEWEKAARGVKGEKYAWGDEDGDCSVAVMKKGSESSDDGCGKDRTWEVGSKRGGVSPYGAHDMGGNVWEWVKDRYDENYYGKAPGRNPVNLESGSGRVVRGGGWASYARDLRAANRNGYAPSDAGNGLGFRCAR